MKEKRLRDGKKDRSWKRSSVQRMRDDPDGVRISKLQARSKEARFSVRSGDVSYALFDPEECLHVGKHDGKVGIVYRFKNLIWRGDPRDYTPSGERGLLQWSGKDVGELQWAAAILALERTGQRATARAVDAIVKSGKWGKQTFWKDMFERHVLAQRLQVIREVMES